MKAAITTSVEGETRLKAYNKQDGDVSHLSPGQDNMLSVDEQASQDEVMPPVTRPGEGSSSEAATRSLSPVLHQRRATLAGLTSPPVRLEGYSLFEDTPRSSLEMPGSTHLLDDSQIERLITKVGAVKLVRQYARDLAARDVELSAVRARSDARERELKRMLRDANIPSSEIEKRLLILSKNASAAQSGALNTITESAADFQLDERMNEALSDLQPRKSSQPSVDTASGGFALSSITSIRTASGTLKSQPSASRLHNENTLSQETQRKGSGRSRSVPVQDEASGEFEAEQSLDVQAESADEPIVDESRIPSKTQAADQISIASNQSSRSTLSWTNIFGKRNSSSRPRASSLEQSGSKTTSVTPQATSALRNIKNSDAARRSEPPYKPSLQRVMSAKRFTNSSVSTRRESDASEVPPTVEMDSMLESSLLPPTMSNHNADGLLVDSFGFIYDRKRKRQQMSSGTHRRNKSSVSDAIRDLRPVDGLGRPEGSHRPPTPASLDDDVTKKSWQEYLKPNQTSAKRPRELLVHTPSASAVITVNMAEAAGTITPPRYRETSSPSLTSSRKSSSSELNNAASKSVSFPDVEDEDSEIGASKALLEQLKELHDGLQAERTIRWNDFFRRVRAERATVASERPSRNVPEADLVEGELIGITSLARNNKTKAKYTHFKSLVLAGIPVSLRPKVWAECSGARALRRPGYYEDLVTRSNSGIEADPEIVQQIKADVRRTLKDNVYFRHDDAPGVQRLDEILSAYALHNPGIGYCQGMNLIAASLLLICATSEDCFWLLVAIVDHILPSGYFDRSLLVARADQIVLRSFVKEVLPRLDAKLVALGVDLEACTFHWFLSLYTGILTGGEALYRVWDVVLCLNSSDAAPVSSSITKAVGSTLHLDASPSLPSTASFSVQNMGPSTAAENESGTGMGQHDGTSSPFLFQLSLALLKLNEDAIVALDAPAQVYTYLNHNMTAHNITIDALINASELLRSRVKRSDVLERRREAVNSLA